MTKVVPREHFLAVRRERLARKMADYAMRFLSKLPAVEARARIAAMEAALAEAEKGRDGKT